MSEYLEVCRRAAEAGAAQLLAWKGRFQISEKGPRDLVTEADLAAQRAIERVVRGAYPDHLFLGEEEVAGQGRPSLATAGDRHCWVVDPLDGTSNYAHNLPMFAVSVALVHRGQPVAGVVLDPTAGECFAAVRGGGATLNGSPMRVSGCRQLPSALVAASFPANVTRDSVEISRFVEVLLAAQGVRRMGSAALNLCYLAAGRLDGYWASSVKSWDVAAGALLVSEAGGSLSHLDGSPFRLEDPKLIAAASEPLHQALRNHLGEGG